MNPSVLYAEPDYVLHINASSVTPNDPRYGDQWALPAIGAPLAWNFLTGSTQVVVGAIDTGVDYTHPELATNMFRNEADCNNNNVDDDGNGFIDDCYGVDFANADSDPMDDHGHGTHVAGIIGAVGNNGIGVTGINWQTRIAACKFLGSDGYGYTSDAIACLEYFAALKDRGVNVVATNNSWGGGDFSQALMDAIDAHRQRGILFITAAGNSARDNDVFADYPADYFLPNVISVAATARGDQRAWFSNYGRRSVHVSAPGADILSTLPMAMYPDGYAALSGTSMAAPHVTGVAALVAAYDSRLDWKGIRNLILAGGDLREVEWQDGVARTPQTVTRRRVSANGSLTCNDSGVLSRLLPRSSSITAAVEPGFHVDLAVLNINCASPKGAVAVAVDGGESVTLLDDGMGIDLEANDGIYSGQWTPSTPGIHRLSIPGGEIQVIDGETGQTVKTDDVINVQVLSPYRFAAAPFNYRQIEGTSGNLTSPIAPPFPILFGGGSFNQLWINTMGTVSLTQSVGWASQPIPTDRAVTLVAPFWDTLRPVAEQSSAIVWEVVGSAPNRELVIEWRNLQHWQCPTAGTVTFQVVFFEGSSDILFNYADVEFGPECSAANFGGSASVGVQIASAVGTQFSFDSPTLSNQTAILWQLGTPQPVISTLKPFTAAVGDPGIGVEVSGSNFSPLAQVRWNGSERPTTFANSRNLQAQISASDIASPTTAQISVFNPEGEGVASNEKPFTVFAQYPAPSLVSMSLPSTISANPMSSVVTVTGANFVSRSVIRWNGADRPTTVLSSTQARAMFQEGELWDGGVYDVTVFTPSPGGGTSNALSTTIVNPAPGLLAINPAIVPPGQSFELTASGTSVDCNDPANDPCYSSFVPSSVMRWNGADLPTIFLGGGLHATIPAGNVANAGTAEITVFSPAPGGGMSSPLPITIVPRPTNDNFATPAVVSALPFTHAVDTRTATKEMADAASLACQTTVDQYGNGVDSFFNSVWYSFTPSTSMQVRANLTGSDYYALITVVSGAPGAFNRLACGRNPNPWNSGWDAVISAVAGTTYYFLVGAYPWQGGGNLVFNLISDTPPMFTLAVSRDGSGTGTVTSSPAGINCGSSCSAQFDSGTMVTLSATPASGSEFSGWVGACAGSGICGVTLDAAKTVTATFVLIPPDTTPPVVSVTAPANSATVFGSGVTVSASATDNVGVVGVQFKLDGANLGAEDTTAPFSVSWDTTLIGNGSHSLSAQARDAAGNIAASPAVAIMVSNSTEFVMSAAAGSGTSATTNAGIPVNFGLSITPTSGFTGPVSFACANLPPATACSVTPNPANVSGTAAALVTVTISTTARSATSAVHVARNRRPRPFRSEVAWILVLAITVAGPRRAWGRRRVLTAAIAALCFVVLMLTISCGGGGGTNFSTTSNPVQPSGTPAGTYTVNVAGTSGTVTRSLSLTVTVN